MAVHKSTLNEAPGQSTKYTPLLWSSFDSGANNMYFDVSKADASKMVIFVAAHSTRTQRFVVGASDSGSSRTCQAYPYSAAKLGPQIIKTTLVGDGHARSKFRSTVAADTEVWAIYALGPFETARHKDSNGYIKFSRGITTAGGASLSTDEIHACALLI